MGCCNCCCKGRRGRSGASGLSAYEIWIAQGNTGTEQDFLDSLKSITEFGSFYYSGNKTVNSGELITFPTTLSKQVVDINSSGDTITLGDAPYYKIEIDTSHTSFNPGSVSISMLIDGVESLTWQGSVVGEVSKHFIIPNPGKGTKIQFKVIDGSYIELGGTDITATVTLIGINS